MLDWLADNLALIMFAAMFFMIFCGYPVAFVMGGMALFFAIAGSLLGVFSMIGLYDIVLRMWGGVAADPILASIPMFIFMGTILERSGSAMDMLLLPPGDIFAALERGVIDATELAFPSIDLKAGFHQVAKHYYFPGWHQQSSVGEFLVNLKKWQELSEEHRRMIEVACDANITWSFVTSEARQFSAMREMVDKHGVKIHFWSDEILSKMRSAWEEVITEESAKDADFKRAHESYAAFRKQYAIWKEHGYLK